jgi:chemotaxis signal transduction protein
VELFLICRIGDRLFAVPVAAVERVLHMAAPTLLPEAPPGVVGVLHFSGSLLPVVDPRPRLGLSTPRFHPDQRLILIMAGTRYLLWLDMVERIGPAAAQQVTTIAAHTQGALVPYLVQLDGESIPVLSPEALDPGLIVEHVVSTTRR